MTGRRFRDARPLALALGLDVPVISHNGALTKHARTLETVAATPAAARSGPATCYASGAPRADALVSVDPDGPGLMVYDHVSEANHALAKYIAWSRRVVGDDPEQVVRRVQSLEAYLDGPPVHVAFSGTCEKMRQLDELLQLEIGQQIKSLLTLYPQQNFALLDVIHPAASKGAGLAAVAAEYGLSREEVLAAGDNLNDLEMLHYAGTGVVMGNAEASLRTIEEFHLTATNDESGVAAAIERFVLKKQNTGDRIQHTEIRSEKLES